MKDAERNRLLLALTPLGLALCLGAGVQSAWASGPCAKQLAAVRRALPGRQRTVAERRLRGCRRAHAVAISPATPTVTDTVTVTIHPWWPHRSDCAYEAFIGDSQGDTETVRSANPTLEILPTLVRAPGGAPVTEWAPGQASLFVTERPTTGRLDCGVEAVGGLVFRFLPA